MMKNLKQVINGLKNAFNQEYEVKVINVSENLKKYVEKNSKMNNFPIHENLVPTFILEILNECEEGACYDKILNEIQEKDKFEKINKKIVYKKLNQILKKMEEEGKIYLKDRKYYLTDRGKELAKRLFKEP
jgi:DNA replicative helicase MCM subunit Mcm2 (Cdc46/Mcm family)